MKLNRLLVCLTLAAALIAYAAAAYPIRVAAERPETLIFIDLRRLSLSVYRDRELIASYPVATGAPDTPSPAGIWRVTSKMEGWRECYGTRWLGLNVPWGSYGIHGTNSPSSIGGKSSLGCIRLHNSDIEKLYAVTPIGATVVIEDAYGALPAKLGAFEPGGRGALVMAVQARLRALGFYEGELDGIYGRRLEAAVCAFRLDMRLSETPALDSELYAALGLIPFE